MFCLDEDIYREFLHFRSQHEAKEYRGEEDEK
jgi:hypothetical protein